MILARLEVNTNQDPAKLTTKRYLISEVL